MQLNEKMKGSGIYIIAYDVTVNNANVILQKWKQETRHRAGILAVDR